MWITEIWDRARAKNKRVQLRPDKRSEKQTSIDYWGLQISSFIRGISRGFVARIIESMTPNTLRPKTSRLKKKNTIVRKDDDKKSENVATTSQIRIGENKSDEKIKEGKGEESGRSKTEIGTSSIIGK